MGKTAEQISYNMSRIRSKDTSIEVLLRRELWKRGLRYRKNYSAVTG
ncbi:MAG: very short patch repair endonuclease, partial [Clostridia bacterium]|nr:very short patch repair endonuclease [Clostridia bacterium]